jgi:hypothetical protein
MTDGQKIIESALAEAESLRKVIGGLASAQVKSVDYKQSQANADRPIERR